MNGGHSASNSVYKISYNHEKDKVQSLYPDWSPSDQRKETARRFRPRFRQDKAAFIKETSNLGMYDGPEFTLKDGDVFYPDYERTLDELNLRTLQLTPDAYSLSQHQTSALINEAFRHGATEVVTSYYRDGEDHRDLVLMKYDPSTGKGKTVIINNAQDGNFHKFLNIRTIAKSQFTTHYEVSPIQNVFILTNKPLKYENVISATNKIAHRYTEHTKIKQQNPIVPVVDQTAYVSRRVISETRETVELAFQIVAERTSRPKQEQKRETINEVSRLQKGFRPEPLTLEKAREKPIAIADVIQKPHREMTETKKALCVVAETHVAVGAAPVLVALLANELPKPLISVEKSVSRHKKKEIKKLKRREKKVDALNKAEKRRAENKMAGAMELGMANHESSKKRKIKERYEMKMFARRRPAEKGGVVLLSKEVKRLKKKEKYRIVFKKHIVKELGPQNSALTEIVKNSKSCRKEKRLIFAFALSARRFAQIIEEKKIRAKLELTKIKQEASIKKSREVIKNREKRCLRQERKRKQREAVAGFSFTFILWNVLSRIQSRQLLTNPKSLSTKHLKFETKKDVAFEKLTIQEPRQWLLLAIIWYLTMIREGGGRGVHNSQFTTKKKKARHSINNNLLIPTSGLIFAYHP